MSEGDLRSVLLDTPGGREGMDRGGEATLYLQYRSGQVRSTLLTETHLEPY